jgi:hypothetical protein
MMAAEVRKNTKILVSFHDFICDDIKTIMCMDKIRANLTVEVRIVSSLLLLWEWKGKLRGEFVHNLCA